MTRGDVAATKAAEPPAPQTLGVMSAWVGAWLFACAAFQGCANASMTDPVTVAVDAHALASSRFPVQLSPNGRHLVDVRGEPFLIKEVSAWGLIQALSESEAEAFMDAVKARGFNTLMISAISYDQRFAGAPPTWRWVPPFFRRWDFSTYYHEYFEHVDRVLELAESKGMLVLLAPCYLGYPGDATQGWADAVTSSANSVAKSREYGRFLGERYTSFRNIIWLAGGDNSAKGALQPHLQAIIEGIREVDSHLWTGHFDASAGHIWSTDNADFAPYMDLDGLYAWTEDELGERGPQYRVALAQFKKGRMIFQLDQSYENDVPYYRDNTDPQWIRRKNYDGLLSGCAGTSFSPGTKDNQLYTLRNWRPLMATVGMQQAQIAFDLFESRAWHSLVPDDKSALVTAGRGTFGSIDYACAARSEHGESAIVYVPTPRAISVDMGKIAGSEANAWWYDPRTGEATKIGSFVTRGTQRFVSPAAGDWVLVLDDASKGYWPPGAEVVRTSWWR